MERSLRSVIQVPPGRNDDHGHLDDIVQSAEKICRYVNNLSFEEFAANDMVFEAVLFNLQVNA